MPTDYLYVQFKGDQVWRLNITNLRDRDEIWRRVDFSRGELPAGMRCMPVGSVLYMVGGFNRIGGQLPNLEVFNLDFDAEEAINACDWIPHMSGPKRSPTVTMVGGRIYFLDKWKDPLGQPVFEVFDPYEEMWTTLPDPPWINFDGRHNVYPTHNFVWAQKIVFWTIMGLFSFDTGSGTWQGYEGESQLGFPILSGTGVEFNGFLIAMPRYRQELVAYKLDSHGNLESSQVLEELREVFDPPFDPFRFRGFVTRFDYDDGYPKMCLLVMVQDSRSRCWARVAIFRFCTSSFDDDGNVVPSATLETLRHYDFGFGFGFHPFGRSRIEYAFGMRSQ